MSTVKVGDRIERDAPVPAGVVGLTDVDGDTWEAQPSTDGDYVITAARDPRHIGIRCSPESLTEIYGPLIVTATREPVPQVYSIPEQPEGVKHVIDRNDINWYLGSDLWSDEHYKQALHWHELLGEHGPITVPPEPPREPRTFPKLDGPPADLERVEGDSGAVYERVGDDSWTGGLMVRVPLALLQTEDGPLTEVFEEATGER